MLEDRIMVEDGGMEGGVGGLMENGNKGMDGGGLMGMMKKKGGLGGKGGWWWMWMIVMWLWWGGKGLGGGKGGGLGCEVNSDGNSNLVMQGMNGNKDGMNKL